MGERKGQNHYYPPDFNYKTHKSLNSYHGTHALRERAKKIKEGILVIRFEMPFNAWCLGCRKHIGMGVRYNAEKKKIGMYYTTPLYEFRMKCHLCDNYFTIRTDPKNFDYEMVEGIQRQEKRPSDLDDHPTVDREFTHKLASDAMFKKEHDIDDKKKLATAEGQIEKLESIQSRLHDDYRANSILRRSFRGEKKHLNEKRIRDEELKKRLSTGISLVPESEDDRRMAQHIVKFSQMKDPEERKKDVIHELLDRPIFPEDVQPSTSKDPTAELRKRLQDRTVPNSFDRSAGNDGPSVKRIKRNGLGIILKSLDKKRKELGGNG